MPYFRGYVDKKITSQGGGDHSCRIDLEAESLEQATAEISKHLKKDEQLGQVVELALEYDDYAGEVTAAGVMIYGR